ncbi:MAG: thiamine pyrophosphate-binding protein [Candidatus Rokuibacteriota bacterium]
MIPEVRVLEEAGIRFVFGMPGGDTGRIFDALYDSTAIQTILVRHEQVGSIMAEIWQVQSPLAKEGPGGE